MLHHLDAAALAAAAGMDLGLDDIDGAAELLGGGYRLVGRESRDPATGRHAELAQQLLGLIFVDVHWRASLNARSTEACLPPNSPYANFGIPYTNTPSGQIRRDLPGRIHQPLHRLDRVLELALFVICRA